MSSQEEYENDQDEWLGVASNKNIRYAVGEGDVVFNTDPSMVGEVFWDVKLQEAVEYAQETDKLSGLHPNRSFPLSRIKQELKANKEVGILLSKVSEYFIEDIALKAWMYKPNKATGVVEKNDIGMAVMKTEEYDFLISSVMPEFEADAKIHDPSRLHLGYWRVTDRLEFDALDNATGADEKDTEKKERLDLFPKSEDVTESLVELSIKKDFDLATKSLLIVTQLEGNIGNWRLSAEGVTAPTPVRERALKLSGQLTRTGPNMEGREPKKVQAVVQFADEQGLVLTLQTAVDGAALKYTFGCAPKWAAAHEDEEEEEEEELEEDNESEEELGEDGESDNDGCGEDNPL